MNVSPWKILQQAIWNVPAVKYVLAVAAHGAVVALGIAIITATISNICLAANPLTPESFFADPEPHVWNDGKIYIYGSHDINGKAYCSDNYHVVWSSDLKTWTDAGVSFTIKDMPPSSGTLLWAFDAAFKDGKYYLYLSTDNGTLGVATSSSPTGPFANGRRVGGLPEKPGIDPAVFIDDDGQGYLYWGQGDKVRAAKLMPNMTEVDPTTIMQPLYRATDHFHEGSSLVKRDGVYYYVYADESRGKRPTCIGYATASSPLGPFKYRGVIIDNIGSDPAVWNNHGRIVEFKDNWYVFYHRSIEGGARPRQTCAEPITFTTDGLIPEVKMTSQGVDQPIDVNQQTSAALACQLSGKVRVSENSEGGLCLSQMGDGDTATFRGIEFAAITKSFAARITGTGTGTIEVRLDDPKNSPFAVLPFSNTNGGWQTFSIPVSASVDISARHTIQLTLKTDQPVAIAWFKFGS